MADTQIRFTVEGMQTIESALDSIIRKADTLTDAWIASGRIVIEDLQTQIELLEKRNDLASLRTGTGFRRSLESTNDVILRQIRLLRERNNAARAGFRDEPRTEQVQRREFVEEVARRNQRDERRTQPEQAAQEPGGSQREIPRHEESTWEEARRKALEEAEWRRRVIRGENVPHPSERIDTSELPPLPEDLTIDNSTPGDLHRDRVQEDTETVQPAPAQEIREERGNFFDILRDFLRGFADHKQEPSQAPISQENSGFAENTASYSFNDQIERIESITRISDSLETLLTEGVRISPDTMEDLQAMLSDLSPRRSPADTRSGREASRVQGSSSQDRGSGTEGGGISDFIRAFSFSNLIRGIDYSKPSSILDQAVDNTASALGMLGGKAGIVGLIISALKGIVTSVSDAKEEVVPYAQDMARLTGISFTKWVPVDLNMTEAGRGWGLTRQEQLQTQATLVRAMGSSKQTVNLGLESSESVNNTTENWTLSDKDRSRYVEAVKPVEIAAALEKVYGVSINTTAQIATAGRQNENFNLIDILALQGQLRDEIGAGSARVRMSEYADILAQAISRQISVTGEGSVDIQGLTALITSFAGVRGMSPEMTGRFLQNAQQSFMNPASPQEEALQNAVFRQINPEASFYDLLEMRENIASGNDPATIMRYLQALSRRSYNEEDFAYNIAQTFFGGNNYRISRSIARDILDGRISAEEVTEKVQEGRSVSREEMQRARDEQSHYVAESERGDVIEQENLLGTKEYEQTYTALRKDIAEGLNDIGKAFNRAIDNFGNAVSGLFDASSNLDSAATKMERVSSRNFQ